MPDEPEDLPNETNEDIPDEDFPDEDEEEDENDNLTVPERIAQARKIVAFMKDNPDFPQFQEELPEMLEEADKLEELYNALQIARQKAEEAKIAYLEKEKELQILFAGERHKTLKRKRDELHRRSINLRGKRHWQ